MKIATLCLVLVTVLWSPLFGDEPSYVFPVQPIQDTSFSKGGHGYPGIDIFGRKGTRFVSPVAGTIEDIQREDRWNKKQNDPELKGGIWVSIIGDDGYRYYGSHLASVVDTVSIGTRVKPGDVLGSIGTSGNAKGTPNHLHFGISLATRPYTWKVRRGEIEPYYFLKCLQKKGCDPRETLGKPVRK